MITIANPIYDSIFKYLLEDERITRTLLSALLKKDVVKVEVRRHEYTNGSRNQISMFRIDFGAHIREADGNEKLVLIELQKTWLETETLRFRQYLGAQYANAENVPKENNHERFALPMVAVYLLGHRLGDIEEPVIYIDHKAYDYDGNEVSKGLPNGFVESLTHDSIFVQIPLLHGKVNNKLDKVLSIFDQSIRDEHNPHILHIDESKYSDDPEMMYMIHRLTAAAADAELRQDMNVEDEYFSALEDRDTAIMLRDKKLKEQDKQIKEQDDKLKEQDVKLKEKDDKLKEKDDKLKEKDDKLKEKDDKLKEKDDKLKEQDNKIAEQDHILATFIKMDLDRGKSIEDVARDTGLPIEKIKSLL